MSEAEIGGLKVKISAETDDLKKGLNGVSTQLKKVDSRAKKTSKGVDKLSKSAKKAGKTLKVAGAALLLVGVGLTAFVVKSAKARREVELLARQANASVEGFESLAFAAKGFGLEAEQVADISKDLFDRLGEFATAGTGTFQDFLDVTKKTKQEGKDLAESWQHLSSEDVIGNVVSELEAVNATGAQTTFVLESLGNDLSKLSPLFSNNSKELDLLTDRYRKLTQALALTENEAEDLKLVSKAFDELTVTSGKAATKLSAALAPAVEELLNTITDNLPAATKAMVDFVDLFSFDNIYAAGLKNDIDDLNDDVEQLQLSISNRNVIDMDSSDLEVKLDRLIAKRDALVSERKEVLAPDAGSGVLLNPDAHLEPKDIKPEKTSLSLTSEQQAALDVKKTFLDQETALIIFAEVQRQEIESGAMSQSQAMFEESNLRELLAVQAQQEELIALYGEGNARELEVWQSLEDQKNAISEVGANQRIDIAKKESQARLQAQLGFASSILNSLASVASNSFKTQKKFAIASSLVSIASGVAQALNNPYPANLGFAAQVAAQGAGLISTIRSTNPSGGGKAPTINASGGSAGGTSSSAGGGSSDNAPESRRISINLTGEGLMSTDQVRELIGQINEATNDGVQLITTGE